jgi:hypothetical protein
MSVIDFAAWYAAMKPFGCSVLQLGRGKSHACFLLRLNSTNLQHRSSFCYIVITDASLSR